MDEYIARGKFLDYMKGTSRYFNVKFDIENFPAADVAPVVHGRWGSNGIPDSMLSACSVCGFGCGAYSFRYCPNCGARMDGAE